MNEFLTDPAVLSPLNISIFIGSIVFVMGLGLWAGRHDRSSEDFYLAGRKARWYGVAGSVFGSNVSANHIVGMMGVGFAVGFAQSHFEITAIAGLLLLAYGFLPVYRKLGLFTLSEYLGRRFGESSRLAYAVIMVAIMVIVQMVPGFYIGSRSLNILLNEGETATAQALVTAEGQVEGLELLRAGKAYHTVPAIVFSQTDEKGKEREPTRAARAEATLVDGSVSDLRLVDAGAGYAPGPVSVRLRGGSNYSLKHSPGDVNPTYYFYGILFMALITGTYTILGGLRAVILTDVLQSVLLLAAGLIVAGVTFAQEEIGSWANLVQLDRAGADRLHLYEPSDHPELPWTGVFSGLMVLHFYYWGTNQFIVQRALAARSDREARFGIIGAGFFKLGIPFFAIGTGIAAYYLFAARGMAVEQDAVFTVLLSELVAPLGFGLAGIVAAGMVGAILSSLDSMMNSAATIFTFDVYRRYVRPEASDSDLVSIGRYAIVGSIVFAALLSCLTMDPNSKSSFFLQIADHQGRLVAGVVVSFLLGMLWPRASGAGSITAILGGVALSYIIPTAYETWIGASTGPAGEVLTRSGLRAETVELFGEKLNFFHTVFLAAIGATVLCVIVSLAVPSRPEQRQLTWGGLGVFKPGVLADAAISLAASLAAYALLGFFVWQGVFPAGVAAGIAATWTALAFWRSAYNDLEADPERILSIETVVLDDRFLAGLLAGTAVFLLFWFV